MKKLKSYRKTPLPFPVSILIICFLGIASMASGLPAAAAGTCVKEINYRILKKMTNAVESSTDINTLKTFDFLRAKSYTEYTAVAVCIDSNGFVTTTTTFVYEEHSYYPSSVYKMIVTPTEIISYDHQDNEISKIPHDPLAIANIPGIGVALSAQEIAVYGETIDFPNLILEFQSEFNNQGGTYWSADKKHYFSSSEQDAVIAPDDRYFSLSHLDHSGNVEEMSVFTFASQNSIIYPEYRINYNYSDMTNGSQMQTTVKEIYLDYNIIENGVTLLQRSMNDHPNYQSFPQKEASNSSVTLGTFTKPLRPKPEFQIYPNPASNYVKVDLGDLYEGITCNWTIKDATGRILTTGVKNKSDQQIESQTGIFSSGLYLFTIIQNGHSISKKFIISK